MAQHRAAKKGAVKNKGQSENEIRKHYERMRGDVSDWGEPVKVVKPKASGRAVFSVRFSASELTAIKRWADAVHCSVSEFVRTAALEYGATSQTPTIRSEHLPTMWIGSFDTRTIGSVRQEGFGQPLSQLH